MNRRSFVLLPVLGIISVYTRSAAAQDFPPVTPPVDAQQTYVRDPIARSELFSAVEFVQNLRADLAPNEYERKPEWLKGAQENRGRVWRVSAELAEKFVSRSLDLPTGPVESYNKVAIENYAEKSPEFEKFLTSLGIAVDGVAASYLRHSMYHFALLNAYVLPTEVEEIDDNTYFWPFC